MFPLKNTKLVGSISTPLMLELSKPRLGCLLWNEATIGGFLLPNIYGDDSVGAVLQQDPSLALDTLWMILKL
ncbi:hypothetical protein NC653_000983 [Populus alba x Populus x berolinensis]|uniref:Uncharacterized protein n=1 Tax=Populus alba x Populus x berolinensis TaxID=444605 RepID=A0AAD6WF24_9ROSI|nr:hypothetical protein NC653_000983 [Populus alba x Populus x berolinensis]